MWHCLPYVLLDALASAPTDGAGMENYPPSRVRAQICLAAISQAGLPRDTQLATDGRQLGEPDDAEVQAVVAAFLSGPYDELGGQTLPAVLTSPAVASAHKGAERLLAGVGSNLLDVRAILAAAALAFACNPDKYDQRLIGKRAIDEVLGQRPQGPRLGADPTARTVRDVKAGRALVSKLARGPSGPTISLGPRSN